MRADADGQGTRAGATTMASEDTDGQGRSASGNDDGRQGYADGQGTRAGTTTKSGEDADGQEKRTSAAVNNDCIY